MFCLLEEIACVAVVESPGFALLAVAAAHSTALASRRRRFGFEHALFVRVAGT